MVKMGFLKLLKAELCRGQSMYFNLREICVQFSGPQLIASFTLCKLQKLSEVSFPHPNKGNDNSFFENYFDYWKNILKHLDKTEVQEAIHIH